MSLLRFLKRLDKLLMAMSLQSDNALDDLSGVIAEGLWREGLWRDQTGHVSCLFAGIS